MNDMTKPAFNPAMIQLPPEPYAPIISEFGVNGDHVGPSETESPWVPFGDSAAIRHLSFDVRRGAVANILWVKGGGRIGTHRHRGAVSAITLEGSWGYYEYDWTATPGSFVYETPGTAHTLYSDDPNGMKAMFWIRARSSSSTTPASWPRPSTCSGSSTTTSAIAARTGCRSTRPCSFEPQRDHHAA